MKTKLLLGLATAAMLTACSNDELVSVNADNSNAIGFSTFVNKSTRATDITNSNLGDFNFAVYGYTKASADDAAWEPIFLNEKVYGSGTVNNGDGSWQYDNLQYWEAGNSYHFHAIAPYGIKEATDSIGTQRDVRHWEYEAGETSGATDYSKAKITFTNIKKDEAAGEQDLIYAYQSETGKAKGETNDEVQFEFNHLLSRVKFRFIGDSNNPTNVSAKIKKVTLRGTYANGDYSTDKNDWTNLGDTTSLIFGEGLHDISTAYINKTDDNGNVVTDDDGETVTEKINETETNHKYVIPISQSIKYGADIDFEITATLNGGTSYHTYTVTKSINELPEVKMDKGQSYVYQISVNLSTQGSDKLIDPILFNVDVVTNWDDFGTVEEQEEPEKTPITVIVKANTLARASTANISVFGNYTSTDSDNTEMFKFDLEQVEKIVIDDEEQESVEYAYPLSTGVEHKVEIYMKDSFKSAKDMFAYCSDITEIDFSDFDTSNITDMSRMFYNCKNLESLDVTNFNTSKVTDMSWMFSGCISLTSLDVTNFNTSKVTNMANMFYECSALTSLDVTKFDTSSVTTMRCMFYNCSSLASLDVSNFNTSNVTDMSYMFYNCSSLASLDVSNFKTSNVTNMASMFNGCTKLTSIDVTNFDTSIVKDMSGMFQDCSSLTSLNVTNFKTSNVTNMSSIFYLCTSLQSLDVSKFNTSKVTDMSCLFVGCYALKSLNVSNFDTSNVTNMSYMFNACQGLKSIDISNFDMSKVKDTKYMFHYSQSLAEIRMNSSLESLTSYNDMLTNLGYNGKFYYPTTYNDGTTTGENYKQIISQLDNSWTKADISTAPKQ
jgi:surface protein